MLQGKYEQNDKSAHKGAFLEFRAFRKFWKSTVTFSDFDDTGYHSMWNIDIVRRFRKPFRIPAHTGKPPQ